MKARAGIILGGRAGHADETAMPKVLHAVAGRPILGHVIAAMREAGILRIVVVTSSEAQSVRDFCRPAKARNPSSRRSNWAPTRRRPAERPCCRIFPALSRSRHYGDTAPRHSSDFEASFAAREQSGMAIVAFRSASEAYDALLPMQAACWNGLSNSGCERRRTQVDLLQRPAHGCGRGKLLHGGGAIERTRKLRRKEYYLTDVPAVAKDGMWIAQSWKPAKGDAMGVTATPILAAAEAQMQGRLARPRARCRPSEWPPGDGVLSSFDTLIGPDAQIDPYVVFAPGVVVRAARKSRSFSHLEGRRKWGTAPSWALCAAEAGRSGSKTTFTSAILSKCKNSRVEKGAKGQSSDLSRRRAVGAGANIGAGTITCNTSLRQAFFTDIGAGPLNRLERFAGAPG